MSWEGCAIHSWVVGLCNFLLFANLWFSDVSCLVYASFEKFQDFTLGEEADI